MRSNDHRAARKHVRSSAVVAVKVADFAQGMEQKRNAPVLISRTGLSKRILGSTYLSGHEINDFTQISRGESHS